MRRMRRSATKKGKPENLGAGVRVSPVLHPRYSWRLSYTTGNGDSKKRHQHYYHSKAEAREMGQKKARELKELGRRHGEITDQERQAVLAFREIVGSLPDSVEKPALMDAVYHHRDYLKLKSKSRTVDQSIEAYLRDLEKKRNSPEYLSVVMSRLRRFAGDYGDWLSCDISTEIVSEWLDDLGLSATSINHFRAALVQLYNHAVAHGTADKNPVKLIPKRRTDHIEIGILKVGEVRGLLKHAAPEILPGVALGLFAGIRRAELNRLDWSEVDLGQGHVEIKASKSKTAARRLIPIRTNLKSLLKSFAVSDGPVMPTEMIWRSRLSVALEKAGIKKWPHNALRHSFASYHLAHFKDAAALALEMGHGSTQMIFEHYRAVVVPKNAKAYWDLGSCITKPRKS